MTAIPESEPPDDLVVLGEIRGHYGVKGWLKIYSFTQPLQNIITFDPWWCSSERADHWRMVSVENGRLQGKGVVAKLKGYDDRDTAAAWIGAEIAVSRRHLPVLAKDEYYWSDLIGMSVQTVAGLTLGRIKNLFATGANDVIVVAGDRERLIPFLQDRVIKKIDMDTRLMVVDWDPDF